MIRVPEVGCTTVWIYLTRLNCILRSGKEGKFNKVWILTTVKTKRNAFVCMCACSLISFKAGFEYVG